MFFVYILENSKGKYYIGQTQNIEERLKRHNQGRSRFTKGEKWKIVYKEIVPNRSVAIKRENEIKKKKSRKYIEKLIHNYRGVEE